jgi:hypothetical protein
LERPESQEEGPESATFAQNIARRARGSILVERRQKHKHYQKTMVALRFKNRLPFFLLIVFLAICHTRAFSHSAGKLNLATVPQLAPLTKTIKMTARRSKTQKLSQTSSDNTDEAEKKVYHDQLALARLYRGVSMLYLGQVIMAFKKSSLTLGCLNVVGGPLMASGVTFLLGSASEKQYLALDTFKRLNGLLVLYATICLGIVALVPQLHQTFGLLFFISGTTTLLVGVKGYFAGLSADGNKSFASETSRLFDGASRVTLAFPPKITVGEFISLWCVATRKLRLAVGVIQVILSAGLVKSQIAPKISQLAKLTILGGSLVCAISLEDTTARDMALVPLNMMISYVFFTMAGKFQSL